MATTRAVYVGTFDGSSWADKTKTLLSEQTTEVTATGVTECSGSLFVLAFDATSGLGTLHKSPGSSISGTWTTPVVADEIAEFDFAPGLVAL